MRKWILLQVLSFWKVANNFGWKMADVSYFELHYSGDANIMVVRVVKFTTTQTEHIQNILIEQSMCTYMITTMYMYRFK